MNDGIDGIDGQRLLEEVHDSIRNQIKSRGQRLYDCLSQNNEVMENMINLTPPTNRYLQHFYLAQKNLNKLIEEERLLKKIRRSKQYVRRDEQ